MYIEIVFIVNFLLDFMILYGTKRLLKRTSSMKRLISASIIGSLTTFILFININKVLLFIIKIIISYIMIIISFGLKNLLKNIKYFYFISIILGGLIYVLNIKKNLTLILLICPILIKIIIDELNAYKTKEINKYHVSITYKEKEFILLGFIDTGNQLTSPIKKETVILVNLQLKTDKIIYVPYKALNTTGIIPCIKPDKVIIDNKEFKNCLIGLAKDKFEIDECNCILPNKFKEELC